MINLLRNKRELKCKTTSTHSIETNIWAKDSVTMKTKYGTTQQSKRQVLINTITCSLEQMNQAQMNHKTSRISLNIRINQEFIQVTIMEHMNYITRSSNQWCNNIWTTKMRLDISLKKITHTCISIWWMVQTTAEDQVLNTLWMAINNLHLCIISTLLQTEVITTWLITIAISTTAKSSNLKLSTKIIWQPWLHISTHSMRRLILNLDLSQRKATLKKANNTTKKKKIKNEINYITLSTDEL